MNNVYLITLSITLSVISTKHLLYNKYYYECNIDIFNEAYVGNPV